MNFNTITVSVVRGSCNSSTEFVVTTGHGIQAT